MKNENKIGIGTASIVGINAMIGAGIAALPTILSSQVGPAGIFSCLFSIMFVMCIGLSLGRMAEIYPGEGWNYLYPSKWGGHGAGIFSSTAYLLAVVSAMGFLTQQAGVWCGTFIPFIPPKYLGLLIIFVLMLLVIAGAEASSITQYIIAACVIIPLGTTAIFCWFHFNPLLLTPFMPHGIKSVLKASPSILFAFGGFESIISLYAIVKNPQKSIPRAFVLAIGTVGFIYLFFFYGILFAIPSFYFSGGLQDTLSNVLKTVFPHAKILSTFVLIGAVFGIIGTLHSMIWSLSTLFTSVLHKAKSSIIKNAIANKTWNNTTSIIVTTFCIGLTSLIFRGEALPALTSFFIVFTYILSIVGLLFIKKEWRSKHNIITMLGLMGGGMMIFFAAHKVMTTFF